MAEELAALRAAARLGGDSGIAIVTNVAGGGYQVTDDQTWAN